MIRYRKIALYIEFLFIALSWYSCSSAIPSVIPTVKPTILPSVKPSVIPTIQPSVKPSIMPTMFPSFSMSPTVKPSIAPSMNPSLSPSQPPSMLPSKVPTEAPSVFPTIEPSQSPTIQPSTPTSRPTSMPSLSPSNQPSMLPSSQPSNYPTGLPTGQPSDMPTMQPTSMPSIPTSQPSVGPTIQPSSFPSSQPTQRPSTQPSAKPSRQPTMQPSRQPSSQPSRQPSRQPTSQPSRQPSRQPTRQPTSQPSAHPSKQPFSHPSSCPSAQPRGVPSSQPAALPSSIPSFQPSVQPSARPTFPGETRCPSSCPTSSRPTSQPSDQPSGSPTGCPTSQPSTQPTIQPLNDPTSMPSMQPSVIPTLVPIPLPSSRPSGQPSRRPTRQPTRTPTSQPSRQPVRRPTSQPTRQPFMRPSSQPSRRPTTQPTRQPYMRPSGQPSRVPSSQPTSQPSRRPTMQPSRQPTSRPSSQPSRQPSMQPTGQPSRHPTSQPTRVPTRQPTGQPSRRPSQQPFARPSSKPTIQPTSLPSMQPSNQPTSLPTLQPFMKPSGVPSQQPFAAPTGEPSGQPSSLPTLQPFSPPTSLPSSQPSSLPSCQPTDVPSMQPSCQPSSRPSCQPSGSPTTQPTDQPTRQPSRQPTGQPSRQPSAQPTTHPSTSVPTSSAPFRGPLRTYKPSRRPTWYPTSSPSSVPSAGPSVSDDAVWRNKVQEVLTDLSVNDSSSGVMSRVNYFDLTVNKTRLLGGCQDWEAFQQGELQSNTVLMVPSSISFTVLRSGFVGFPTDFAQFIATNSSSYSCSSNASIVVNHINGNVNRNLSQLCDGHVWKVQYCPLFRNNNRHTLSVCVDCVNPCDLSTQCPVSYDTSQFFSNIFTSQPCFNGYQTCYPHYSAFALSHILSVAFIESQPAPSILSTFITTTRTAASVSLTLSSNGSVFCAAYLAVFNYIPTSPQTILSLNQGTTAVQSADGSFNATVVLSGLAGATSYNVFCTTVSASGAMQSIETVWQNKNTFKTECCKQISVQTTGSYYYQSSLNTGAVLVSMDSTPRDYSVVTFFGENVLNGNIEYIFTPRQVIFDVTANYAPNYQFALNVKSYSKGTYNISYSIVGEDKADYSFDYPKSRLITIMDELNPPPAPILLSTRLSSDLNTVICSFDTPTNKGKLRDYFTCSALFTFTHSNVTTCQWSDASTVLILLDTFSTLSLQDSVVLVGNVIRAECGTSVATCDGWDATQSITRRVQSPSLPFIPKVFISSPASIGQCENFTLDLTSSIGSGGRAWKMVQVNVTSKLENAASALAIQTYFSSLTPSNYNSVVSVPAAYFEKGTYYLFSVTLCNFGNVCGLGSVRLIVMKAIVPSVTIYGGSLRSISRAQSLSLTSLASLTYCADAGNTNIRGSGVTSNGVSNIWSASVNGKDSLSLVSSSKDPSKFVLPAYSLVVNTLYVFTLTSSFDRYDVSATSSVNVFVSPGNLVANIAGGSVQYASLGQIISLDASGSFDEDSDPVTGLGGTPLLFSWNCYQIAPVILHYCTMGIVGEVYSKTSTQLLQSSVVSNSTNLVTVTVRDLVGSRMAQSSVSIVAVNQSVTQLALSSNVPRLTMNLLESLVLTAKVVKTSKVSSAFRLTCSDVSLDLSAVSLLPTSVTLLASSSLTFAFRPNVLTAGTTNTFTLTAVDSTGSSVFTSIVVAVNAAPRGGAFTVSPSVGVEISTLFQFVASSWTDSDYPLTFLFGIRKTASAAWLPLQERSQLSSTSTVLPSGLKTSNFTLPCVVTVFDVLNANTSAASDVIVYSQSRFSNSTLERLALEGLMKPDNNSINTLMASTSIASLALNAIDCSKAPNCSALNRFECSAGVLPHTCGSCFASHFVGDSGAANSQCLDVPAYTHLINATTVLGFSACNSTANCSSSGLPWQECHLGRCRIAQKQCVFNCSGHGVCVMQSVIDASAVSYCATGNSSCVAVCECRSGFFGLSCGFTTQQFNARNKLREKVSSSLLALSKVMDASVDVLSATASVLKELTQFSEELSVKALSNLVEASDNIVTAAKTAGNVRYEVVSDVISAVDQVVAAQLLAYPSTTIAESTESSWRRRLATSSTLLLSNSSVNKLLINTTESILQTFGQIVSASMTPGQSPVQLIANNFRTISYSFPVTSLDRFVEVVSPVSLLESYENYSASSFRVKQLASHKVPLLLTGVQWSNKLFGNSEFQSDSFQLHVDSTMPCATDQRFASSCEISVEVVLQNHNYLDFSSRAPAYFHAVCGYDDFKTHQYRCPSGMLINASCNGSWVELASRCDYIQPRGVCNSVVGVKGDSMNNGCNVTAYDSWTTTCLCPIVGIPPAFSRHLASASSDDSVLYANVTRLSGGGSGHFVSSINFDYMEYDILHLDYVPDTTPAKAGWKVITTVAGLLCAMILCVSVVYYKEMYTHKDVKSAEKAKERQSMFFRAKETSVVVPEAAMIRRTRSVPVGSSRLLETSKPKEAVANTNRISTLELKAVLVEEKKYQECPEMRIVDQALPFVFRSSSYQDRVINEMKQFHRYLNLIFVDSKFYSRMFRILSLTSTVICFLFMLSIVYAQVDPNNGYCEAQTNRQDCLRELDPFGTGDTRCYWDRGFKLGSCHFKQPVHSLRIVLFATVFAVIASSPLAFLMDYTIQHTLAVPSRKFSKLHAAAAKNSQKVLVPRHTAASGSSPKGTPRASTGGSHKTPQPLALPTNQLQPLTKAPTQMQRVSSSIRPGQPLNVISVSGSPRPSEGGNRKRAESTEKLNALLQEAEQRNAIGTKRVVNNPFNLLLSVQNVAISTEKEDITSLLTSLREYRETLSGKRKKIFDDRWGLVANGGFATKKQKTSWFDSTSIDILKLITRDLKKTRYELTKEIFAFKKYLTHSTDRKRRILYLFLKDLTYGLNSQILENKQNREILFVKPIASSSKAKGWMFVLLMDIGMLVYIYYFAMQNSASRQNAWFRSLLLWVIMDCIFVSTLVTYISHLFIPMLIKKKVAQVKLKLIECMKEFNKKAAKAASVAAALAQFNRLNGIDDSSPSTLTATMKSIQEDDEESDEEFDEEGEGVSDIEAGNRTTKKSKKLRSLFSQNDVEESARFNTARTLFLSYRLAEEFLEYRESRIVTSFVAIWPIKSYLPKKIVEEPFASLTFKGKCWRLLCNSYKQSKRFAMFSLSCFLLFPVPFQDFVIYLVVFVLFGVWMLFHLFLYDIHPAYALIPSFVMVVVIHFVVVSSNSSAGDNLAAGLNVNEDQEFDEIDESELEAANIEKMKSEDDAAELIGSVEGSFSVEGTSGKRDSVNRSPSVVIDRQRRVANVLKPKLESSDSMKGKAAPSRVTMLEAVDRISSQYMNLEDLEEAGDTSDNEKDKDNEAIRQPEKTTSSTPFSNVKGRTLAPSQLEALKSIRDKRAAAASFDEDEEEQQEDFEEQQQADNQKVSEAASDSKVRLSRVKLNSDASSVQQEDAKLSSHEQSAIDWVQSVLAASSGGAGGVDSVRNSIDFFGGSPGGFSPPVRSFKSLSQRQSNKVVPHSSTEDVRDAAALVSSRFPSVGSSFDMSQYSPKVEPAKSVNTNSSNNNAVSSTAKADWALNSFQAFSQKIGGGFNVSRVHDDSDEDSEELSEEHLDDKQIPSDTPNASASVASSPVRVVVIADDQPAINMISSPRGTSSKNPNNFLVNSNYSVMMSSSGAASKLRTNSAAKTVTGLMLSPRAPAKTPLASPSVGSVKGINNSGSSSGVSAKQKAKNQSKAVDRLTRGL